MLGYVRVDAQELRLREYECYRALYCGLCRRMGKCTGQCSRLSLSYDFVFLAATRISLLGEEMKIRKIRCLLHPLHRRRAATDSPTLDYCANASALLTYHKVLDDLKDERGFRRFRAALLRLLMSRAYRKAKKRYPNLDRAIEEGLTALSDYEKSKPAYPSADTPAALFGELMAAVFCEGLEGAEARIAAELGRSVGHWIYLADAADDFSEDKQKGRFNPYLELFGESPTPEDLENLRISMTSQLMRGEGAMLLIDAYTAPELKEILYNIMYLGMPTRADGIIDAMKRAQGNREKTITANEL